MGRRRAVSAINVTPFVDVMLVLLVIFLVTAPMMESGIDVNLPKVESGPLQAAKEEPLVLTIDKKGIIRINKQRFKINQLNTKLKAILKRRSDRIVYIKADAAVSYGHVAKAMAIIRGAGVSKIAMITEPPPDKR